MTPTNLLQPWLITAEALQAIHAASFFDRKPDQPPAPASPCLSIDDGVGVVAIRGPMLRQPGVFERAFLNACDTEEIARAVEEAASRADVQAIFLDIDSPGGSVNGTPELAQAVADAAKSKYVYAFTAGQMCSAAYWVASQADAIYAAPSARVGSIGVILPVLDSSGAFDKAGLKLEVFAAGKFKSAGTPGVSLTEDQRTWLQTEVEETAADFRAAVLARGRQIPDEAMEGQTFSARRAQRMNLAGTVRNRAEAMARLRRLHARPVDTASRAMSAPSLEDELAQAREQITKLEADLTDAKTHAAKLGEDAKAQDALMAEANEQITALTAKAETLSMELGAANTECEQLSHHIVAAQQTIESLSAEKAALEAAEKDIEKRAAAMAARIVAETGTPQPAAITPKGDNTPEDLVARFQAITDPAEQTAFWRTLSTQQRAAILSTANP